MLSLLKVSTNNGKFSPYFWQQAPMRRFRAAVERQRMPHAILISGPAGIGKLHMARCLAHYTLQKHTKAGNFEALLLAGSHPDVLHATLPEDKKLIVVEQIRGLTERVYLTPQLSDVKIAIIHPAELMVVAAANALLKTLEEPPGNALIILVSNNYGRLSPTIRSRCQHISLNIPDISETVPWLRGQGVQNYREHLELTGGAPLTAKLAAENDWLAQYHLLMGDLSDLIKQRTEAVTVGSKWRETDSALLIGWVRTLVNAMIKSNLNGGITANITDNYMKNLKTYIDRINLRELISYSDFLDKSALEINNNLNRDLFLEQAFSRWAELSRTQ